MAKLKRGKLSAEHELLLENMLDTHADEEIARVLHRSVDFVARRRLEQPQRTLDGSYEEIIARLHASHMWKSIKEELFAHELDYFEKSWAKLIEQFSEQGIQYSDEMMIHDLIMQEINIHRYQKQKKQLYLEIEGLEAQIKEECKKPIDNRDADDLTAWHSELNGKRQALNTLSGLLKDMQRAKANDYKQLRTTREQRFKDIEESKVSIWDRLKELSQRSSRRKEGKLNLLAQLAAEAAEIRLAALHEYEDGDVDRPILTSETVGGQKDVELD
jgi:hypothetical protein